MGTFVPRRPEKLTDWLDSLPTVVAPDLLVPTRSGGWAVNNMSRPGCPVSGRA